MKKQLYLSLIALGLLISSAQALETDRPDFTEGSGAVDENTLQVESGYTYSKGAQETHTFPEFLFRYGVLPTTELRLGWLGASRSDGDNGWYDIELGVKQEILSEGPSPMTLGILGALVVPTGSSPATEDEVVPVVKVLWAYDLSADVGVAGNVNAAWPDEDGRYFEGGLSLSLATSLTDDVGGYVEYFSTLPEGGQGRREEHLVNCGVTYALSATTQLDARIGFGVNDAADDLFAGVGWAVLFGAG